MRRVILFLLVLLAGCASGPVASTTTTTPTHAAFQHLIAGPCSPFCEPSIAADATDLFLLADAQLQVSSDQGRTFTTGTLPPLPSDAPPDVFGNDAIVQTSPEGLLYYSALLTSCVPGYVGQYGACPAVTTEGLQVAHSLDAGKTWTDDVYLGLTKDRQTSGADRQWLAFGPPGTVCLVYQRYGPLVVFDHELGVPSTPLNTRSPSADSDQPVACSTDAGRTFSGFTSALGGAIPDRAGIFVGGRPVMSASGLLCAPHHRYDSNVLEVACSTDRGATFQRTTVAAAGNWFPMMGLRGDGALGVAWVTSDARLLFAQSLDQGKTWSSPIALQNASVGPSPWLEGTATGWRATWFTANGNQTSDLHAAAFANGTWSQTIVQTGIPAGTFRTAGTDYACLTVLPDGRSAIIATDPQAKQALLAIG